MPGVKAILTADDLPQPTAPAEGALLRRGRAHQRAGLSGRADSGRGRGRRMRPPPKPSSAIALDFEPLPFVVDPLASLRPGGPNARREGNAFVGGKLKTVKWTAADFAAAGDGALPMGEPTARGGPTATSRPASTRRRSSSTRRSTRSATEPPAARDAVGDGLLAERQALPALLDAERGPDRGQRGAVGRRRRRRRWWSSASTPAAASAARFPARTSMADSGAAREEDRRAGDDAHQPRRGALHRPHPPEPPRPRQGRLPQGRPRHGGGHVRACRTPAPTRISTTSMSAPGICSLAYQPLAMRFRGLSVLTNTPPRTSQRSPGGMQQNAIMEPVLAKAARQLGIDPVDAAPRQRARRQGAARPARQGGQAQLRDQRLRARGDRQGRGALQLGRAQGAQPAAARRQGARRRRLGEPVHRRLLDRLRRPADDPPRRQAVRAVGRRQPRHALGHRHGARRRPRCSTCRGTRSRSSGATPASTCRGPARRTAARPSTRCRAPITPPRTTPCRKLRRSPPRIWAVDPRTTRSAASASIAAALRRAA